jgi:competence ComEA-like helix-hairpin-helix protein
MMRLIAVFLAVGLGSASAQTPPPAAGASSMPDGAGKPIVQRACAACHALTVVTSKHASQKEWDQVVNQMVSRGADLTDDEIDTVIEYLAKNYGPLDQKAAPSTDASSSDTAAPPAADTTPVNVNKASAQDLESSLGLEKSEAEALVKYREQNGNFKTWHDVAAVPGISAAKIEGMQKRITF